MGEINVVFILTTDFNVYPRFDFVLNGKTQRENISLSCKWVKYENGDIIFIDCFGFGTVVLDYVVSRAVSQLFTSGLMICVWNCCWWCWWCWW